MRYLKSIFMLSVEINNSIRYVFAFPTSRYSLYYRVGFFRKIHHSAVRFFYSFWAGSLPGPSPPFLFHFANLTLKYNFVIAL